MNTRMLLSGIVTTGLALAAAPALADRDKEFEAKLEGVQEVPMSISTPASGRFELKIDERSGQGHWRLTYKNLENVLQAHIHFGQRHTTGGISVFLCSNLGNGPVGTQLCPPSQAKLEGTFVAADIVGPAGQGITPGEFDELIRAIKQGATYANVHSSTYPGGEIRGQIKRDHDERDHDKKDDD